MKKYIRITAAVLLLIISVSTFTPYTLVSANTAADISLSAELSDNGQYINFNLDIREGFSDFLMQMYGTDTLCIYSLLPHEDTDDLEYLLPVISDITPVSQVCRYRTDNDSLYRSYLVVLEQTKKVPLTSPETTETDEEDDEDSEETVVATTEPSWDDTVYIPLTEPIYITSQTNASKNNDPFPVFSSKKGLDIQYFTDAQRLGVSHTTIRIDLNEYLTTNDKSEFYSQIDGENIYFDKNAVTLLDHKIKIYSDAGINVILNFVLSPPSSVSSHEFDSLYYEGASDTARYCAINVSNERGYILARACAEFFTGRYISSTEHGFAGSFIIGHEINSNITSNSMGRASLSEYVAQYAKLLRVFTTAALKNYSNAKIYVPLGNSFAEPSEQSDDHELNYSGLDILHTLNEHISSHGDIPWRLTVSPYPSNKNLTSFWNDPNATDSLDAPYITMNNIDTLTKYMNQPMFYFESSPRSVLISELGFSSGNGAAYDDTMQAASFAYAYYKAETDSFIDAVIYSHQTDSSDGGLNFGLWRQGSSQQLEKKKIHEVFAQIDTESSAEATAFALDVIGVKNWGEIITGCSPSAMHQRTVIFSQSMFFDGEKGLHTTSDLISLYHTYFIPSDNTFSLQTSADSLTAVTYNASDIEYRGIGATTDNFTDKADYIKLGIKVNGEKTALSDIMLVLRGVDKDGKEVVYEGTAQVYGGDTSVLYFPVTEYFDKANMQSVKIWAKPYTDHNADEYSFTVTQLSAVSNGRGGGAIVTTVITLLILFAVIAFVFLFLFFFTLPKRRSAKPQTVKNHLRK